MKKVYRNALLLSIWVPVAILYLTSALSNDQFVSCRLPTIGHLIGLRGFVRRQLDISVIFILSHPTWTAIFYDSKKQTGLPLFSAISGESSPGTAGLKYKDVVAIATLYQKLKRINFFGKVLGILASSLSIVAPGFLNGQAFERNGFYLFLTLAIAIIIAALFFSFILNPVFNIFTISKYFLIRIKKIRILCDFIIFYRKGIGIKKLIASHNSVCADIALYNRAWKEFYFLALIFSLPYSLLMLHPILFGNLHFTIYSGYVVVYGVTALYIFFTGFVMARVSHHLHDTRKRIHRVLLQTRRMPAGSLNAFCTWLDVINCLERMSSPNRKVGFTCLTLFTIAYPQMVKVNSGLLVSFFNFLP